MVNGRAESATYQGRAAIRLVAATDGPADSVLAVLDDSEVGDATIDAEVAGAPRAGAPADSRGFIGIAFRVQPDGRRSETFYLRPTNGRADDQLRRNHAVQSTSEPDFPWHRLRTESPGQYEAYADLEPGAWTTMRIEVSGRRAALYVNGATQPCLIVTDLKLGAVRGRVALWAHASTNAYFSRLSIHRH